MVRPERCIVAAATSVSAATRPCGENGRTWPSANTTAGPWARGRMDGERLLITASTCLIRANFPRILPPDDERADSLQHPVSGCLAPLRRCGKLLTTHSLGSGSINRAVEAAEWRTYRTEIPAGKAGCLSKRIFVRDGSHSAFPAGFGQNGLSQRQEVLKYRHIPAPSFLATGHFDSNLEGAVNRS